MSEFDKEYLKLLKEILTYNDEIKSKHRHE